ncbi:MAG: type 1 glutamine amidotransferase [Deltaproteobacteria bacterium]|nr:type 1 glutamine amidotransferase [Deltaproteobacteria bacterium]
MNNKKEIVILEHTPSETAGTIIDFLTKEKLPFRIIRLYENTDFPPTSLVRALIVMGGSMNVYEEEKYPFLKKENTFIQNIVQAEVPYLGICLGAQLLAKALHTPVYKAKNPEIGWYEVELLSEARRDPLFQHISSSFLRVLHWHEDTFDLPKDAHLLAASKNGLHQAYRFKELFYGLQFHIEINRETLLDWFEKRHDKNQVLAEYDAYQRSLDSLRNRIYKSFTSLS